MPDLTATRQKLKIAVIALAVVDALALAILFSPLVGSARSRDQQLSQLGREVQQKTRAMEPLQGLDKKVAVARQQIDLFYKERLPSQESAISEAMGRVAAESGVKMGSVKYTLKDPEPVGLQELEIEGDFSGGYLQLMRFINSLERDQVFFLIDSVDLGGEQDKVVKLQLKLETYLKTGK
jgi:type IV pilus assembly protein PilO